ncbi:MAG: 3-oxo-5-alpha-steroid 4-dehydrogenase-domain-containing protein [Monoraphidium minutum]|nr:MAG: 3-oxo-5-alpha-steroid 4-dehydrogenase-domain-containing protein [Monoraphidium minutum]
MLDQLVAAAAEALPPLLRAYWVLAAGSVVATLLPVPLPRAFKDAVTLSACRGKLWQTKPEALGRLKDWSLPQAWFLHFYLVGAACNAAVLMAYSCSCCGAGSELPVAEQARSILALSLFQAHLVRRALETALVMRYPPDARMHGVAYVFGLSYYAVVPLSLLPADWIRSVPGLIAAAEPGASGGGLPACAAAARGTVALLWHQGPAALALAAAGAAVFACGNVLQCASHCALANLTGRRQQRSEKTAYRIPRGLLFEWVSCPHYLAEIIIYCGLALVTGLSTNALLMLVWVAVNLVLAAGATQAWYHARFKTYPAKRRALVPFVY